MFMYWMTVQTKAMNLTNYNTLNILLMLGLDHRKVYLIIIIIIIIRFV